MKAPAIRIAEVEVRLAEAWTRMPFRYGSASLTAVPILMLRLTAETAAGKTYHGHASDCLPPRWFDKDPAKDFRRNVEDQIAAVRAARAAYLEAGREPATAHALWERAYPEVLRRGAALGLNKLTASFGSSFLERAAIDAACRAAGASFHDAVRGGLLGYAAGEEVPERPLASIHCRHTVGLADPILRSDIPAAERLDDGLPQALEEDIEAYGLRYFKVKVSGDHERDLERLERIARLLAARCPAGYSATLDGNEQYRDLEALERLIEAARRSDAGRRFLDSVLFIEQPLAREVALDPGVRPQVEHLGRIRAVIIDESDDDLDAFERAAAIGYRGCSSKNCKGIFKALRNRALALKLNREAGAGHYFQSGEDLNCTAVVPLQEDLATLAALGIGHAERNGHHYYRGLSYLPARERDAAAAAHPDLYERREGPDGGEVFLRVRGGRIECASLQTPGYGYASGIAFEERVPLDDWRFERLKL